MPDPRDAFDIAAAHIADARVQLSIGTEHAVRVAQQHLADAIERLRPAVADDEIAADTRRAAERCRATLSSYLLASEDLDAAGVERLIVARLLRRGIDSISLDTSAMAS